MLIAESYGGRDEPVDALVGNFVDVGLAPAFDPLRVKGTPTEQTYQEYEETGTDLAQLLTQKVSGCSRNEAFAILVKGGHIFADVSSYRLTTIHCSSCQCVASASTPAAGAVGRQNLCNAGSAQLPRC